MAPTAGDAGEDPASTDQGEDSSSGAHEGETPPPDADDEPEREGSYQVTVALLFGAVLTLIGLLGPVLGGANGDLLVFGRNYLHDAIHLLSGVAGLAAGYVARGRYAADYNRTLGIGYLLVTLLGFLAVEFSAALLNINLADNLLHLALAVAFLGVGFALNE